MRKTIQAFLDANQIEAVTYRNAYKFSYVHPPSCSCFETLLTYQGKQVALVTYGGRIPLNDELDPTFQLSKIHYDLQGYEETFERFCEENGDYLHWLGRDGARAMWAETGVYWSTLLDVLGEDLFWKFYRLDDNAE